MKPKVTVESSTRDRIKAIALESGLPMGEVVDHAISLMEENRNKARAKGRIFKRN